MWQSSATEIAVDLHQNVGQACSFEMSSGIPPVEWGPKQAKMLKDMLADGVSRQDMAKRLKVSVSTLQRKLRELRAASR